MKKILLAVVSVFLLLTCEFLVVSAQSPSVGINETGTNPHASSILDLESTNKGFLPPRMTTIQRDAISNPAEGLMIYNSDDKCLQWYIGTVWYDPCDTATTFICGTSTVEFIYNGNSVIYGTVVGQNGTCWLDRNLGASQVAASGTDTNSYGDLFQWGRADDGHQLRTSSTQTNLSTTDQPPHSDFILTSTAPNDWRSDNNNNRWNVNPMVNNPCPVGWRVPTEAEYNAERNSWVSLNAVGAINSPLKLPMAGYRDPNTGLLGGEGSNGYYWTSTVSNTSARFLLFNSGSGIILSSQRANGSTVRCIKD
ncbi:MAG: hypothetical protein EA412_04960 [Chitinophagaceae bacterium]|nr:MAG: hypothetical protein EA412_04960 [Chitinophagaceae bacterium]